MTPGLDILLLKAQAVLGTPETSLSETTDLIPMTPDSKIEAVPSFEETDTVNGGFLKDASVRGITNANGNIGVFVRSLGDGATDLPDFHLLALASGWKYTLTACEDSKYKFVYGPCSDPASLVDLTAWYYSGALGSNKSLLRKFGNILGDWKISGKTGGKVKFELAGIKGVYISEAAATRPSVTTASSVLYPGTLPLTVLIDSVAYNVQEFSFEGGNQVDQYNDCEDTNYGGGATEITKKAGKFEFTAYADAGKTLPMSKVLDDAVEGALTLVYGPTGQEIGISVPVPQYKDCKQDQSGNLTVWKVSGEIVQNNIVVSVNNSLTPTGP